jgi:16S rRNA G966 N2-methylase RsmD
MLRRNLEVAGFRDRAEVVAMEVLPFLRRICLTPRRFDLIFLDPPYQRSGALGTISLVAAAHALAPSGMVILELSAKAHSITHPDGLARVREVRHGDSILQVYRQEAA